MIPVAGLSEVMPELEDDVEAVEEVEAAKDAEGASCAYCSVLSRATLSMRL